MPYKCLKCGSEDTYPLTTQRFEAEATSYDGSFDDSNISESDQTLSPQKLLSGNYDKDFNYSVLSQNSNSATIELIPIDKRKSFQKVTLVIDKLKSALSTATILDKSTNNFLARNDIEFLTTFSRFCSTSNII